LAPNYISDFLDYLIPRFCTVCNSSLKVNDKFICCSCRGSIQFLSDSKIESEFQRKFYPDKIVDDFTSLYIFDEGKALQKLIHELKYGKKFKIGIYLGHKLGHYKKKIIHSWNADFIIPIPLFTLKRVERGFNQSFYIAKGLSKETKIPIKNNLAKRTKNTISQTTLSLAERKENINEAFILNKIGKIQDKRVIILDDIITTGATVSELAKTLKNFGAFKVFTISVATPPISHSIGSTDSENS
jgi:ComF family protein